MVGRSGGLVEKEVVLRCMHSMWEQGLKYDDPEAVWQHLKSQVSFTWNDYVLMMIYFCV